jgi:RHS repeat-associated protein
VKTDFIDYPWQNWTYRGSEVDAHWAGFEQSGGPLYRTPARQYSGSLGRWLTPDPLAGEITNPQSLNRYTYVLNQPTTLTDPSGLECVRTDEGTLADDGQGEACGQVSGPGDTGGGSATYPPDIPTVDPSTVCMHAGYGCPYGSSGPQLVSPGGSAVANGLATQQGAPATNKGTVSCSGSARLLQGNAATIGKPGGFSGPSVGNIPVTANGAAIIPKQWGGKAAVRPFLNQISGVFPGVNYSFQGVVDIIGGAPPRGFPPDSNVQADLMQLNPGKLILELPGAPRDFGTTAVTITAPGAVGCPAGTVEVMQ